MVGAFKNLLTDLGEWHPSMDGLDFNRIDGEEAIGWRRLLQRKRSSLPSQI